MVLTEIVEESNNTNVFTDVEYEKVSSDWLRYDNIRSSREKKLISSLKNKLKKILYRFIFNIYIFTKTIC